QRWLVFADWAFGGRLVEVCDRLGEWRGGSGFRQLGRLRIRLGAVAIEERTARTRRCVAGLLDLLVADVDLIPASASGVAAELKYPAVAIRCLEGECHRWGHSRGED